MRWTAGSCGDTMCTAGLVVAYHLASGVDATAPVFEAGGRLDGYDRDDGADERGINRLSVRGHSYPHTSPRPLTTPPATASSTSSCPRFHGCFSSSTSPLSRTRSPTSPYSGGCWRSSIPAGQTRSTALSASAAVASAVKSLGANALGRRRSFSFSRRELTLRTIAQHMDERLPYYLGFGACRGRLEREAGARADARLMRTAATGLIPSMCCSFGPPLINMASFALVYPFVRIPLRIAGEHGMLTVVR